MDVRMWQTPAPNPSAVRSERGRVMRPRTELAAEADRRVTTQEDPHILAPDHLPTPFTAAEIRDASPPGLAVTVVREAEAQPRTVSVTRFVDGDEEGSSRERQMLTADGQPVGEPTRARAAWLDLQAHASFPSATTTRTEE